MLKKPNLSYFLYKHVTVLLQYRYIIDFGHSYLKISFYLKHQVIVYSGIYYCNLAVRGGPQFFEIHKKCPPVPLPSRNEFAIFEFLILPSVPVNHVAIS